MPSIKDKTLIKKCKNYINTPMFLSTHEYDYLKEIRIVFVEFYEDVYEIQKL